MTEFFGKLKVVSWQVAMKMRRYARRKEAEVRQTLSPIRAPLHLAGRQVLFDVKHARRALPYVARIARDAADAFRHVQCCRFALDSRMLSIERHTLEDRREEAMRRLNACIDECNAVGVDLMSIPNGVVRFRSMVRGKLVSLVWRLSEPVDTAWQDMVELE